MVRVQIGGSSKGGSAETAQQQQGQALAVTADQLRGLLRDVQFTRDYGFVLNRIGDGMCTLDVPFDPKFGRPGGVIAGQVFMTAADVAMWFATKTRLGLDDPSVTSSMSTAFLRSASQETFTCVATILRLGKRQIYGVAECRDAAGNLLTHHVITYARL